MTSSVSSGLRIRIPTEFPETVSCASKDVTLAIDTIKANACLASIDDREFFWDICCILASRDCKDPDGDFSVSLTERTIAVLSKNNVADKLKGFFEETRKIFIEGLKKPNFEFIVCSDAGWMWLKEPSDIMTLPQFSLSDPKGIHYTTFTNNFLPCIGAVAELFEARCSTFKFDQTVSLYGLFIKSPAYRFKVEWLKE